MPCSEVLLFSVLFSSHLALEVLEESSLSGSSELINLVGIGVVVSEVSILTIAFLHKSCAAEVSGGVGGNGLLDDGLTTLVETTELLLASNKLLLASKELLLASLHNSVCLGNLDNGLREGLGNNGLIEDLVDDFLSVLNVSSLHVSFSDDGNVFLFDEGGVLFVDNGLMVLVDVLLVHDGLVVLVNNVLVVLVDNVSLVFNEDILVVLMDDILMDFFNNGSQVVGLHDIDFISPQNFSTFVDGLNDGSLSVLNDDWLFVDLLNDGLSSHHLLATELVEVLSLNEVSLLILLEVSLLEASERLVSEASSHGRSLV